MRKAPRQPNENERRIEPAKDDNLIVQTREYELITPLFGGGVEPGQCDDLTPIRGTEIRGHLRFWWRAMCGGQFEGDLQAMKVAENELWGAASTNKMPSPSIVKISITIPLDGTGIDRAPFVVAHKGVKYGKPEFDDRGNPKPTVEEHDEVAPPYAAFPLRPEGPLKIGMQTKAVRDELKFNLEISFPRNTNGKRDYEKEVGSALWAWETFGGVGARTRRGFGAVRLLSVHNKDNDGNTINSEVIAPLNADKVEEHIRQMLPDAATNQWHPQVPRLSNSASLMVSEARQADSGKQAVIFVWNDMINYLRDFRQTRNGERGRSKWPEPEKIRGLTLQRLDKLVYNRRKSCEERKFHQPIPPALDEFPRAAFGLPIVFHFKDSESDRRESDPINPNADPRDTSLQIDGHDRLASSLILRPLACADNQAIGIALLLMDADELVKLIDKKGMILKTMKGEKQVWKNLKVGLDATKATKILKPGQATDKLLGEENNVLNAFINWIKIEEEKR